MNESEQNDGVWFVYDGECPLCSRAALALRIQEHCGPLHLIDARSEADHPLMVEIARRRLDLDEGMIIYHRGYLFHGEEALRFMADFGDDRGLFNRFNKLVFSSPLMAKIMYPWLRAVRNLLIRHKNISKIDNLNLKGNPIFKAIFGASWNDLPPVMKAHYTNRPYTDDRLIVQGTLDVLCTGPIRFLASLFLLIKSIPPYTESAVPVSVAFRSDPNTKRFHFERTFYFKNKKPYNFHSYMMQVENNDVIEITAMGMGWRVLYEWRDGKVIMRHKGWNLRLFGYLIPIPLHLIIGEGYAEEIPVDDHTFDMCMHLTHKKWGKIYEYKGRFQIKEGL